MKPEGLLLEEIELKNGLSIQFYDQSRPIVGGRCQVQLVIYIPLKIREDFFKGCDRSHETYEKLLAEYGGEIAFRQEKVRNFIAESEVNSLLQTMKDEFLQANLNYLEKPQFEERYVLKNLAEAEELRLCARAHREAIAHAEVVEN